MELRNYQDNDESQIANLLNLAYGSWGSAEYWKRKYKHTAGFDPKLIFLAEDKGKVIACVQYLRRDLKLGNRILHSYVGGDAATHPKYVGRGLFSKLLSMLYDEVKRRKGCCVYGYNQPGIYENFYRKRFGEVALHRLKVMIKVINPSALAVSILPVVNAMMREKLRIGKDNVFTIRLELIDQTSIDYCIKDNEIRLCKITVKPDIRIKTKLETLGKIVSGNYSLLKALMLRKIVISISPLTLIRLLTLAVKMRLPL